MTHRKHSSTFTFESHYIEVHGSNIHYIDEGDPGAEHTFLLLHGNPTSSYLWRDIIPHLTPLGRVIVPDLIGFGNSDKPKIDYSFKDHIKYINGFIGKLCLSHIILVLQDWGSAIGFNYAVTHEDKVDGIVFFEAITKPFRYNCDFTPWEALLFKAMRHKRLGKWLNLRHNFFIEILMPFVAGRRLNSEEMSNYRAPFPTPKTRKPVWMFPREVAINGIPKLNAKIKARYRSRLQKSTVPKLMFYTKPGLVLKYREAKKLIQLWPSMTTVYLGIGGHYLQEQYPHEIGEGIASWYRLLTDS